MSQFFIQCEPIFFHCYTVIETTSPCYYCVGTRLRRMTNIDDGADIGSFHDKSPQKKFFLTTTSLILMKIVLCGYPIAKTYWCKYYVSTTNTF